MRKVINISFPKSLSVELEKEVRQFRFASKSEFFRYLFRLWLEDKLISGLEESRRELVAGRGKALESLRDLR